MNNPQVDRSHYDFNKYSSEERFVSYYWQLKEVLILNQPSILEIGVGDRVFGSFIKNNTTATYTSLDITEDLHPDVVGNVIELPFADKSFDVVCAFEVLEHLPFDQFDRALSELARVSRSHIVISVPHFGPMISFSLKIPFVPQIRCALKIPFPKKHMFNGQHYWELGTRGYSVKKIKKILLKYGGIAHDFVPFGNSYHHFFTLKLKNA